MAVDTDKRHWELKTEHLVIQPRVREEDWTGLKTLAEARALTDVQFDERMTRFHKQAKADHQRFRKERRKKHMRLRKLRGRR